METQQQQQQYVYPYQVQQPQTETLTSQTQTYDSSQIQSYDHQSYYAAAYQQQHYYNQPQDYSSYYYHNPTTTTTPTTTDYATSYQSDPNLIHPPPPGVPISVDSQQTHLQNLYYPPPIQGYFPAVGSQPGRSLRGRGTFGRRGRGRIGGRGKYVMPQKTISSAPAATSSVQSVPVGQAAPDKPSPRMAWCEICKTNCTTFEVLEQHKNGKRHKRNLKLHEELQNLSRHLTMQDPKLSASQPAPATIPLQKAEGSYTNQPPNENVALMPAAPVNKGEATAEKDTVEKPESSGALPPQEFVRNDHFGGRGGLKRKMRGGRGNKWMRAFDGSKRIVEPPKPKLVVPLICNLCNVKCESQVVFESHIAGKKHLSNMKRFQGHKEVLGDGIQSLYPTIAKLPSSTIVPPVNQQGPHNAEALASMMLSQQNLQDPQAAHAALAQLLHQHGIHDAQTLITQLVPYLVAQSPHVPSTLAAGLGIDTQQNSLSQGAHISVGAESQNFAAENQTAQQDVTSNVESQDKPADAPIRNDG